MKKKTPAKEKQTQGFAPRPRERRAAVHSLCYSVGSSAHSPANALELGRVRARAACCASRSALSKHSRLSPLERALCSLFFANIASLYPPPAALRRRCPRSQIACSTAARLLETCSTGFIKSLALPFRSAVFDNLQRQTFHCRVRRLDAPMPRQRHEVFVNIYFADCRGELRSPAFEVYIETKRLRDCYACTISTKRRDAHASKGRRGRRPLQTALNIIVLFCNIAELPPTPQLKSGETP